MTGAYYSAPADPPEQRQPEPMATCDCDRPLVLGRADADTPLRCFLCTRPVAELLEAEGGAGQVDQIEAEANGDDPVHAHNNLLLGLLGLGEQDQ
ncbi:MAG: hypothetical protein AABM42_10100 [Actinomycetota bacterium]